ncbi:hypothetical protein LXL04_037616 [Taraxacum kok-saghyz]
MKANAWHHCADDVSLLAALIGLVEKSHNADLHCVDWNPIDENFILTGECAEKLQLLSTLDERESRLQEIPDVHSDFKMNPHYESDDTEEYFNKEHGDHMESKYSEVKVKKSRSPKKRGMQMEASTSDLSIKVAESCCCSFSYRNNQTTKAHPPIPDHLSKSSSFEHNLHFEAYVGDIIPYALELVQCVYTKCQISVK